MYEHQKSPLPPENHRRGVLLHSKVSIYGAIFFCLNLILLSVLLVFNLVFNVDAYSALAQEDALVENSTAFLFFLTALLLLAIVARGRGVPGRWLYLLGAFAFVFAAGEEISWGQRIFGFETPSYLREINLQNEFNLHNIDTVAFQRAYQMGMILLCVATSAAYFARKSSFFGVPLPSILTMYCFLLVYAYQSKDIIGRLPLSIFTRQHMLPLLFVAYACFSRERRLFTLSALFLAAMVLEQSILHTHGGNGEEREYLFSIACVVYAGELFLTQQKSLTTTRVADWLAWSVLVCVSIVGVLLVIEVSDLLAESIRRDRFRNRIVDGLESGALEPVRRANFDIFFYNDEEPMLVYAKTDCVPSDTEARFFLHVIPANTNDLPFSRRQYEFDNLDFDWDNLNAIHSKGKCVGVVQLPDYPIVRIRTGQYIPSKGPIWQEEFSLLSR